MRHRLVRARAQAIISVCPVDPPTPVARVRGLRVLIVRRALDRAELLRIRAFEPDVILCAKHSDADLLRTIGYGGDYVDIVGEASVADLAAHIRQRAERWKADSQGRTKW